MANVITGTGGDDYMPSWGPGGIEATDARDMVHTYGGNDSVDAEGGNDTVDTGSGNDYVAGGLGNDWIAGQTGDDVIFGDAQPAGDWWNVDPVNGGNDQLYGGAGNDYMDGEAGNDRLSASLGNDTVIDVNGANRAFGGDGDDYLHVSGYASGGRGADWLQAESSDVATTLNGGAGADMFQIWLNGSADPAAARQSVTIQDFHAGQGDHASIGAGVTFADGGTAYAQDGDLFSAFDSNHSGRLGDGDDHAFSDGHGGVVAQWFNVDLHINTQGDWLTG
jgi:Ca2+-binding RTX toxin-like protein